MYIQRAIKQISVLLTRKIFLDLYTGRSNDNQALISLKSAGNAKSVYLLRSSQINRQVAFKSR